MAKSRDKFPFLCLRAAVSNNNILYFCNVFSASFNTDCQLWCGDLFALHLSVDTYSYRQLFIVSLNFCYFTGGQVVTKSPVKAIVTNDDGSVKHLLMRTGEIIEADEVRSCPGRSTPLLRVCTMLYLFVI